MNTSKHHAGQIASGMLFVGISLLASLATAGTGLENTLPGKVEMQPLWDGKTLDGWQAIGGGEWKVDNGTIHGTSAKTEKRHGHLVTKDKYKDFVISLEFRALTGNSGLYFRVDQAGQFGVKGFQAEIDATKDVGGLYETGGRGWVSQPSAEQVKTWFLPGEWNKMMVVARDGDISVFVNGQKTAELTDDPGRKEGHIALQLHGGQDMDVHFRELKIAKLPPETDEPASSKPPAKE